MTGGDLFAAARSYTARGWRIIPIGAEKKPPKGIGWKRWQSEPPGDDQLRRWFTRPDVTGLAVVLGSASGGLCVRDFDDRAAFDRWRADHADLARVLPQVETHRGGHVYFRHNRDNYAEFDDGELRGDAGHYVIAPPSRHPSGSVYRWVVPLPNGPLPLCSDFIGWGLIPGEIQPATEHTEPTEPMASVGSVGSVGSVTSHRPASKIENAADAVDQSLPHGPGQRNERLMLLARMLKSLPALADADPADLRPIVADWHKRAIPLIATKDFSDTWADFVRAWGRVQYPYGAEPMTQIVERAIKAELPAAAMNYDSEPVRFLVALCAELQRAAGDGPFYLSCRTAARLCGIDHVRASRYLNMLAVDKVLSVETPGTKTKATRYRYRGEL